jgi:hypothetical protein
VESSGSKSLVFFGQPAYIFYVRFNHFRAVKIPVKRVFDPWTVICGGFVPALLWGWVNAGRPLTDRLTPGTVRIDSLPGRWLPALRRWIMGVRADRQKRSPKTPLWHPGSGPFRGPVRRASGRPMFRLGACSAGSGREKQGVENVGRRP